MRADTHDGPEQMLHVRGLIHCCSSHVRRSWSFCLATHGRAIHSGTKLPIRDVRYTVAFGGAKRTSHEQFVSVASDPFVTSGGAPSCACQVPFPARRPTAKC